MTTDKPFSPSDEVAACYAEMEFDFALAAQLFQKAGDGAGGHTKASQLYAAAARCRDYAKNPAAVALGRIGGQKSIPAKATAADQNATESLSGIDQ